MKLTVYFKPNTSYDYGVRLMVNIPFLRLRSKSIEMCTYHYSCRGESIGRVEIFVPNSLISEVPKFFIGELRMLSSQILDVQRA